MTLQDFIPKYNNTYVEVVDPTNKNQCMDLAIRYCMDVLGTDNRIFSGLLNAYEIFEKPTLNTGTEFDFIKNNDWAIPRVGDILVFKKAYNGTAGHVVVVIEASINSFKAFSQNDPTGSKCVIKTYTYANVSGWLRSVKALSGSLQDIEKLKAKIAELEATNKRLGDEKDTAVRLKDEILRKLAELDKLRLSEMANYKLEVENNIKKMKEAFRVYITDYKI